MTKPTFSEEETVWKKGVSYVVGLDEVGRGAFAGPVVVGAVVFKNHKTLPKKLDKINDSKKLSAITRETLTPLIKRHATGFAISQVSVRVINKIGIGKATEMAFRRAISQIRQNLKGQKIFILIDGFEIKYIRGIGLKNQKAIIKGDQKSVSIAAASIIAKTYRDSQMDKLHIKFPVYSFLQNKGYGTEKHRKAIKTHGLCKEHRTSFDLTKYKTE